MTIRINIVDPDALKIALEARKTLDGKIMILDHLHIDIILDTATQTITTFPKESLSEEVYETQNAYFSKLQREGVVTPQSIQGGNVFGSLQATYPNSSDPAVNSLHVVLLATKNFIKEELPYLQMEKEYEDELDQEYLDPPPEDTTPLGQVPEEPKKGSITPYYIRNYLGGYFNY
tara:strand:+ start:12690 stop:13214 length:525 start_codon:yes stop_codon:yes gene_type:complete